MKHTRRAFSKLAGAGVAAAAIPQVFAPAIAQDKPLKIGILAPRSGVAGTAGECGIRAVQWAAERMNKAGGIAGRKFELVIEEETNPKDTIERFRRLVLQEKVDAVHGLISTGVSPCPRRRSTMAPLFAPSSDPSTRSPPAFRPL